jgi:hypothetical protein
VNTENHDKKMNRTCLALDFLENFEMYPYLVTIQTAETYANWRTFASSTAEAKAKVCAFMQTEPNSIHSVKKLKN